MGFLNGTFNIYLVISSISIALITSFTAFDIYLRKILFYQNYRRMYLTSSAGVLGLGIWCIHFIGTLAYKPINLMNIDPFFVMCSLFISIAGSYFALAHIRKVERKPRFLISSLIMMVSIVAMHMIGMQSLDKNTMPHYHLPLFFVSILLVLIGAYFSFRWVGQINNSNENPLYIKLKSGLTMGLGVLGFHYTLMFDVSMSPIQHYLQKSTSVEYSVDMTLLAIGMGFSTLIILGIVLLSSYREGKFTIQSQQLKTNEQYYQSLYRNNPDLVITFDVEGNFLSSNKVVESYGYTVEELIRRPFAPLVVPDQLEKTLEYFLKAANGTAINYETALYSKLGDRIEVNVTLIPIIVDEEIVGVYGIHKDITSYKYVQEALVEAELKYRNLVEDSLTGIYIVQEGRFVYVNPQFIQLSGYTNEELVGAEVSPYIFPEDLPLVEKNIQKRIMGEIQGISYQYRAIKKDQSILYLEVHASKTLYKGKPAIIGSVIDITEQKRAEKKIQHMAYHDALTGLPNRYQFNCCFQTTISNPNLKTAAILFLDLDRFKLINDTLGHDIGDLLLKEVSGRLKDCIGTEDCLARLGGDEFILFLPNRDQEDSLKTAEQILACLNTPFLFEDYEMLITPSVGISQYPQDGKEIGMLIKKADLALHQAKRMGKNNFQFYKNESLELTNERFKMEKDLRNAIEHEEFVLYYQPKVNIRSGEITGLEALIRWQHPDKGIISPAQFIPLAEETGMIVPIGEWVLRKACAQMKTLQENGFPRVVVSVNLSVRQFFQPNLLRMVSQVLDETGLYPEYLDLEITESMMIDTHHALFIVSELKKLGVKISLDDFGTGYSSLHYLKKFPIDILKIDQSFIRDCASDANDDTLVKTIIAMAHQLKMKVIAEGVKTKDQLIFLQQNLCNEAQGYLFSKPLPIEEIKKNYNEIEQIVNRLGVPQELRDQKWLEEALEIAQQELQETIRQQQGMTFKVKEQDGKFIQTLCDGELLYRMGFVPEQIIGKELHEFLPADMAEEKVKSFRRAWNGEQNVSYEAEYNGIYYLASLRPIRRGGHVVEVIASCVDITDRKWVEEALRLSESKYRLIAENMSDLVGILDMKGVLQYASPSHETVLGFSPKEIEGTTISHLLHPEDDTYIQNKIMEMALSKKPSQVEFRHKHAKGHWIHMEAQGTPVLGENGEIENLMIVARDITERKQAEEYMRKSERLAVVGELAAGIAHEIRNPLTSIKGFVQLLKLGMRKPEYFDIMLTEFQHLESIIHEFLILAKPQVAQREKTDLFSLVKHVIKLIETQAALYNIQIRVEFETEFLVIFCDENQLKQVFINLLKNAVESMPDGGEIVIQVKQKDVNMVSIRIIDKGFGLSSERMKRLGEPFYSTKEKGTGLGLMVSFRILEEHQGTINFESDVGRGTTVEVILPLDAPKILGRW